ncbi:MAG: hypothetical protein JW699_03435, partial [Chitinispirillaceae bacterium]|nr:hypothetical protein [Chitinispirillaceae bacterium]
MLNIKHAKSLQGQLTLPPSTDLFLVAAMAAIACRRKVRIHPVRECPYFSRLTAVLDSCAIVSRENDAVIIDPRPAGPLDTLVFPDDQLPYRDLVVFIALGMRSRVLFQNISEQRLSLWCEQSQRIGFAVEMVREGDRRGLAPGAFSPSAIPPSLQEHDISPALGLLFGLRAVHSFQIDCALSTPLRDVCAAFGCSISVQRDIGATEKDPLIRRMRIKARQRLSSQDQLFTVTADFSARAA